VEDTFDLVPDEPALKNCSSVMSERALSLPRPMLGGGVTKIFFPREEPLEIVTGDPPRTWLGKPSPGRAPRARSSTDLNSSSKSPVDPVRLNEVPL
jgi:hypothetical protein